MKSALLLVLSFIITAQQACCQHNLRFERIEGLSQSTGYSILKDKQGFIWVATGDGLNRYDGIEMKAFKAGAGQQSSEMKGRIIRSNLLEDEHENIWFSTEEALQSFNKRNEKCTAWPLSDGDGGSGNSFASPIVIVNDHLWLASPNAIFDLDLATKKSIRYQQTIDDSKGNRIQLMYHGLPDKSGNFWFATNKGLLRFSTTTHQWSRHLDNHVFYSLCSYQDTLYVSEGKDVLKVAIDNMNDQDAGYTKALYNESDPPLDLIHRVYKDDQDNIWIGDEAGNVAYRSKEQTRFNWVGNINHASSIRTNYPVYSFYSDSTGVLWTGAYMIGLMKADIKRNQFNIFPKPQVNKITEALFVNAFCENGPDEILLATFQKGIIAFNKATGQTRPLELPYNNPAMLYGNSVHVLYTDHAGNLWTGSTGYLYVRQAGHTTFKGIKIPAVSNALQNAQAWCMTEYNDGWLLGTNVGLYFVSAKGGSYSIEHLEWLKQTKIINLWKSANNEVWIAPESEGAIVTQSALDGKDSRNLLAGTNVRGFTHDGLRNVLWICTSNGLVAHHLPSGKQKIFSGTEGLTNSYTYAALQDENGLWVSTSGGLFRAGVRYGQDADLPEISFVNFTVKDGLPDNQYNIRAAYKDTRGVLYFGTPNGIVWFDPTQIESNSYLPKVVMTDITVNGQTLDGDASPGAITDLHLPYIQNNLFFRFRGIEYTNPSKVQYMYKLDGWDNDWIKNGVLNEARYNNLSPGTYSFMVKAANSSGAWSNETYTVNVIIDPPFWKTWWFYGFMVISAVTLIVIVIRRISYVKLQQRLADLERQRELDRERQRISREMHDDIGAGLTQITLISEYVRNKNKEGATKELNEIANTSRQLVNNMSEIIWSLNPESPSLGHLLSYLREQLNKQLEYSGIEFQIKFPDNGSEHVLSNVTRRNILLATREIVNNAIRHSNATKINVHASLKDNVLSFEISDNGTGFDSEVAYAGNGLKNIRERITTLGGKLKITSASDKGTVFAYSIAISAKE